MRLKKRRNTKIVRIRTKTYIFILLITLLFATFHVFINQIERRFFPAIMAMSETIMQTKINQTMYEAAQKTISEMNLTTSDFYTRSGDSISVNSILVNEICAKIAVEISNSLSAAKPETVTLPIGAMLGLDFLSNYGPDFSVVVLPMGNAVVDFETSFISVGINQVNFQIWLNIESNIRIVNPLQETSLNVKRKIALMNTVIRGEIPHMYFNNNGSYGGSGY